MPNEQSVPDSSGVWGGVEVAALPAPVADALVGLMADVDAVCAGDVAGLDGRQAEVVLSVVGAALSRLSAARARLLPVVEADGWWALSGARSFPVWLSHRHAMSVHAARTQVRLARRLRDHLPATAAAAVAGDLTVEQATLIAELGPTSDARRGVLTHPGTGCDEAFLVEQAQRLTVDETRVLMRQWAAYADPDADDHGYVEAADREHLDLHRLGDGYRLSGQLTVEHGQVLKAALAAVTPVPGAGHVRSTGQRRAQALADLARLTLDHGLAGTGKVALPRVSVLVDYPTFTALLTDTTERGAAVSDNVTGGTVTAAGAQVFGRTAPVLTPQMLTGKAIAGGSQFEDRTPVPRLVLARLACDSEVKRSIFGPDSEILDVGRSRRTFPRAQRAAIVARDKHCRYPGCHAPPAISECHHVQQWARDHGDTKVDNGILLCWYHHDLVHRRTIDITRRGDRWHFTDARGIEITSDDVFPAGASTRTTDPPNSSARGARRPRLGSGP